jgi:integrase
MTKRRGNAEGSIYRRADGRWAASVSLDRGRRKSYYGKTRQEVAGKLATALKAQRDGLPLVAERQRVGDYLASWLETVRPSLRARTWLRYEQYVRLHAIPGIGQVSLARLTPQHLQRLYADRLEGGLSAMSVRHLHAVLHRALQQATRWGLVARNVADLVTPPRAAHREMQTLSPEQARAFLEAAQGDRFHALYVLALSTGMRQGELLALKWEHVDLERGTVQVRGSLQRTPAGLTITEPKTAASRRQVGLTPSAVAALRRHRVAQTEERLRLGSVWQDNGLVFCNEIGSPIDATHVMVRPFRCLLDRAGLPRIRFHDLRHSAATLLLGQGVHPKIVSEMLGHTQIAITLDLYSHVTPTMQRQATDAMEAVLTV